MNAYELADELENYVWMNPNNNRDYCKEVKDMLRQQAEKIKNMEIREKKYLDRIATLENQLDKCSHHETMAHQGGYEIGYTEGLKKASEK
jgi:ABC-type Zn uptake system ZnuABC Zn-binding protein ZnuA